MATARSCAPSHSFSSSTETQAECTTRTRTSCATPVWLSRLSAPPAACRPQTLRTKYSTSVKSEGDHRHRRVEDADTDRQHGHHRRRVDLQSQYPRRGHEAHSRGHEHVRRYGRRNEHGIFVRGFGRWQVPLAIDGIRIYLPAANRLDFNRFFTRPRPDRGAKGVRVGPRWAGWHGRVHQSVTRKPTEPFEGEFRSGVSEGEWDAYARAGSLQDEFYVQGSVSYLDRDYWEMSDDFVPTAIEDGGEPTNRTIATRASM